MTFKRSVNVFVPLIESRQDGRISDAAFANFAGFVAHLDLEVTSNEKSFIHFDGGYRSGKRICF